MARLTVVIVTIASLSTVLTYENFRSLIPNGYSVPNPCGGGDFDAVGHYNSSGGGTRNLFGLDFEKGNNSWSEICRLDSDGDGYTNGDELGDPNCDWTIGDVLKADIVVTHPGFCDSPTPYCDDVNAAFKC